MRTPASFFAASLKSLSGQRSSSSESLPRAITAARRRGACLERTLLERDDLVGHFLPGSPLIVHRIDDLGKKVDGLRLPLRILEELERFLELLREPEQELLLLERQSTPRWS